MISNGFMDSATSEYRSVSQNVEEERPSGGMTESNLYTPTAVASRYTRQARMNKVLQRIALDSRSEEVGKGERGSKRRS